MSTTMLSSPSSLRSTLNPNAPLFVPSAFKQVEDFSPKWWELVQTTAWYRDYWFNERQQYESLYKDEEGDIESLLPDSIDLDLEHDMSLFEAEAEMQLANRGFENEREVIMRNLNLNAPRNGGFNSFNEQSKYKPMNYVNPKCSPRYSIHQPR